MDDALETIDTQSPYETSLEEQTLPTPHVETSPYQPQINEILDKGREYDTTIVPKTRTVEVPTVAFDTNPYQQQTEQFLSYLQGSIISDNILDHEIRRGFRDSLSPEAQEFYDSTNQLRGNNIEKKVVGPLQQLEHYFYKQGEKEKGDLFQKMAHDILYKMHYPLVIDGKQVYVKKPNGRPTPEYIDYSQNMSIDGKAMVINTCLDKIMEAMQTLFPNSSQSNTMAISEPYLLFAPGLLRSA